MKKKWITQAEINKILKTYSIQKDEFIPVKDTKYFYQSQLVKGYTISISEETKDGENYSEKTGRILVSHSQWNGRKTYNDIWERTKNGTLQFKFRNLWNQPISDVWYIKELEHQVEKLTEAGRNLQEQLKATENNTAHDNQKLIIDNEEQNTIKELQEQIKALKQENEKLKSKSKHNARGAGRKPSKDRIKAIDKVRKLLQEGYSDSDIIKRLGISIATYYRYKREAINN